MSPVAPQGQGEADSLNWPASCRSQRTTTCSRMVVEGAKARRHSAGFWGIGLKARDKLGKRRACLGDDPRSTIVHLSRLSQPGSGWVLDASSNVWWEGLYRRRYRRHRAEVPLTVQSVEAGYRLWKAPGGTVTVKTRSKRLPVL
ncbi:hypothetical protein CCMA1212_003422 [Trichoderma ghanense]|uniref:Uncharacterized protein n=1 Tax=Trichoderma ghanense TaxID=65468 RepID=A0ABY2H9I4_9HYPO